MLIFAGLPLLCFPFVRGTGWLLGRSAAEVAFLLCNLPLCLAISQFFRQDLRDGMAAGTAAMTVLWTLAFSASALAGLWRARPSLQTETEAGTGFSPLAKESDRSAFRGPS